MNRNLINQNFKFRARITLYFGSWHVPTSLVCKIKYNLKENKYLLENKKPYCVLTYLLFPLFSLTKIHYALSDKESLSSKDAKTHKNVIWKMIESYLCIFSIFSMCFSWVWFETWPLIVIKLWAKKSHSSFFRHLCWSFECGHRLCDYIHSKLKYIAIKKLCSWNSLIILKCKKQQYNRKLNLLSQSKIL